MTRSIAALLLALLLFLLPGCAGGEEEGYRLYCLSDTGGEYSLSALDYELWSNAPSALTPEQLFQRLMAEPQEAGHRRAIPQNTQLLSWMIREGELTLDLSEHYQDLSGIDLTLANFSLAMTMTQLQGVERVVLLSEGAPLPGWGDTPFSPDQALFSGELRDPILLGFHLWFPTADRSGLSEEYRETEVYEQDTDALLQATLKLLVAGPDQSARMSSPFVGLEPRLQWHWADQVCVLELTESWSQVLRSDELALRSLVNSLCSDQLFTQVAFTLNGEAVPGLEGVFGAE